MLQTDKEIGKKYGRLTVIMYDTTVNHVRKYLCQCDCGTIKSIGISKLRSGWTKSCGCLQKETVSKRAFVHGDARDHQWNRIYTIWHSMIQRCENPHLKCYKNYGGRGITVCEIWHNYERFKDWAIHNGYTKNLSLDRIKVDGNYCPHNCRWADSKTQARNTRRNRLLTFGGKTQCVSAWCEELKITESCLRKRLRLGWSVEKALLTPVKKTI